MLTKYKVPYISLSPISQYCNEHGYVKEIVDRDVYYYTFKDNTNMLSYFDDEYGYTINGNISYDEAIKILNSVKRETKNID